jgi:L-ascorbate metabolism protein UlaG (beta-lactamase superfamily)
LLKPKVLVPMHFGTFSLLTGKPGELKKVAAELGFELMEFKPGERKELRAGQLVASH